MIGLGPLTKGQRLLLGIIVLLLVDVIRVTSSTLQEVSVDSFGGFILLFGCVEYKVGLNYLFSFIFQLVSF